MRNWASPLRPSRGAVELAEAGWVAVLKMPRYRQMAGAPQPELPCALTDRRAFPSAPAKRAQEGSLDQPLAAGSLGPLPGGGFFCRDPANQSVTARRAPCAPV